MLCLSFGNDVIYFWNQNPGYPHLFSYCSAQMNLSLSTTNCNFFFSFWISVSDLLDYITPDADMKAREAQKKARSKVINLFSWIYSYILLMLTYSLTKISSHRLKAKQAKTGKQSQMNLRRMKLHHQPILLWRIQVIRKTNLRFNLQKLGMRVLIQVSQINQ